MSFWSKADGDASILEKHGLSWSKIAILIVATVVLAYTGIRLKRILDGVDAMINTLNHESLPMLNEAGSRQIKTLQSEEAAFTSKDIPGKLDKAADNLVKATASLPLLVGKGVYALNSIQAAGDTLNSSIKETSGSINNDLARLGNTIDAGTLLLDTEKVEMAGSLKELTKVLQELEATEKNVNIIMDPKVWNSIRDSAAGTMVELHGIAKDTHDSTTYLKGKLIPPKKVYSKNPFVSVFQHIGYYMLNIIKTSPGTILALLQFISSGVF